MTEVWLSKPQSTVEVKGLLGLNNNFAGHHCCKWSVIVIQSHSEASRSVREVYLCGWQDRTWLLHITSLSKTA